MSAIGHTLLFFSRLLNFAVLLEVLQEDGKQVQEPTDKLVNLIRIFHAVYFFRQLLNVSVVQVDKEYYTQAQYQDESR